MNKPNNIRKRVFANKLHKQIFFIVLIAALVPTIVVTIGLYYLIFGVISLQLVIPEVIAYNIIPAAKKVIVILSITEPIIVAVILFFAHKATHAIIGPFDRLVKELDECIEEKKEGHIVIRKNDKFWLLVQKINKLLDKLRESKSRS